MNSETIVKKALYHCDIGNIHRPTKKEADDGVFFCPKCRSEMMPRKGRFNFIHICINDDCRFFLRDDQLNK